MIACQCEAVHHFSESDNVSPDDFSPGQRDYVIANMNTGHKYLAVPAGSQVALHVGPICDECANTHMKGYMD